MIGADLITVDRLSLEAYATDEEISIWREQVLREERQIARNPVITKYLDYTNYSYGQHEKKS